MLSIILAIYLIGLLFTFANEYKEENSIGFSFVVALIWPLWLLIVLTERR